MADEELTEQEKMDKMVAELSADIEDVNQDGKDGEPETEKTADAEEEAIEKEPEEPAAEGEGAEEELTEQEKMDKMVAELSADIEDINQDGKDGEPETENVADAEEEAIEKEPEEPAAEGEGADEELTDQEKMDRMVAELSADIEDINQDEKDGEQETENAADAEEEPEEEKASEAPGADEKKGGYEETTIEESREQKEKDLEKAIPDKPALEEESDEGKTEDLAIGLDLHQEESDVNEAEGDEKAGESIDGLNEYEYPDMEEAEQGGKKRRHAVVWSIVAILVLVSVSVWYVTYKDVNILEHPMVSRWVQKLKLKPASNDVNDSESQLTKSPTPVLHVKAPQISASSSLAEVPPDPFTKSEMFEQKIQQILVVRDKLSEKRAQAASIREKLNEQILALKLEILAKQRAMAVTSYKEAVKAPRIGYNIKLIQQLKAYTSKLSERIRYYEEGYDKMRFRYQETEDNFKIIELWSDAKTKRLVAKIDKAINEYQAANKPHMFTNKQIVLDNPLKIWTEVIQSGKGG